MGALLRIVLTIAQKYRYANMQVKGLLIAEHDHGKESRLQGEAFLTAERGPPSRLQEELQDVCEGENVMGGMPGFRNLKFNTSLNDGQGQTAVTEIVFFTVAKIAKFQEKDSRLSQKSETECI